jgi:hypothetical protein
MIESPKGFDAEMKPLHLNEFRNAVNYFKLSGKIWETMDEKRIEAMYMESQGSWKGMYEHLFGANYEEYD